jgi:DNA-binding response OmpR family regulator
MERAMRDTPAVLLVEPDREARERLGSWLEMAGFEVRVCPGPSQPEYSCIGVKDRACPLARDVELIVVDLWLESERVMRGSSWRELLSYYRSAGSPVLAVAHRRALMRFERQSFGEPDAWIEEPPDRRDLIETANALVARGSAKQ